MNKANDRIALGPEEVARQLGCGRTLIFQMLRNGELPSFRLGARRLIRVEDVQSFVKSKVSANQ